METELITKLIPNAVSAVAVIVIAYMFLKEQRKSREEGAAERTEHLAAMHAISQDCHARTETYQKAFRDEVIAMRQQGERLANGYHEAMQTFAAAIAANGEVLKRIERRGVGRRDKDWKAEEAPQI